MRRLCEATAPMGDCIVGHTKDLSQPEAVMSQSCLDGACSRQSIECVVITPPGCVANHRTEERGPVVHAFWKRQ